MDDPDAAVAGERDREAGLGHGVHRRGHERDVQRDRGVSRVTVETSFGSTCDSAGSRQHVVEREPFLAELALERDEALDVTPGAARSPWSDVSSVPATTITETSIPSAASCTRMAAAPVTSSFASWIETASPATVAASSGRPARQSTSASAQARSGAHDDMVGPVGGLHCSSREHLGLRELPAPREQPGLEPVESDEVRQIACDGALTSDCAELLDLGLVTRWVIYQSGGQEQCDGREEEPVAELRERLDTRLGGRGSAHRRLLHEARSRWRPSTGPLQ